MAYAYCGEFIILGSYGKSIFYLARDKENGSHMEVVELGRGVYISFMEISCGLKSSKILYGVGIVNSLGLAYKQVQKGGGGRRFCSVEAY